MIPSATRPKFKLHRATALGSLGKLYVAKGEYARAEPLFQRALAIQEQALRADDPLTAATVGNLAALNYYTGNYSHSEALYQRAIGMWEKTERARTRSP